MKALSSYPNPLLSHWRLPPDVQQPNLWYRMMKRLCQLVMCALWQVRVFDRHHEPAAGGVAYICNHQSFLDPMLMSFGLRRPMNFMARDSLFRFPGFGRIISSLNAFPVKRATADTAALKESMRRLKSGGQVVVFAEGTRTHDGRIGPFLPGVAMLAQRAAEWTVPVLIDGAYECWPRTSPLPLPGSIVVRYGRPIHQSLARAMTAEQFVQHVRQELIELQADVRRRTGRPVLDYNQSLAPSGDRQ